MIPLISFSLAISMAFALDRAAKWSAYDVCSNPGEPFVCMRIRAYPSLPLSGAGSSLSRLH